MNIGFMKDEVLKNVLANQAKEYRNEHLIKAAKKNAKKRLYF